MVLQSGILFRLSTRTGVRRCCRFVQTASVSASVRPHTEPLRSPRRQGVFPVHEAVLTQIRCDILSKDTYRGRVIDHRKTCKELLKRKLSISNQSVSSATRQLEGLTEQELVDFVQGLAHSALSKETLDTDSSFLQLMENECCSRAKNWDSAVMLLVADAFFVLHYLCSRYLSVMFREFEHRWMSMVIKKEDVVQLATYIIMGRKFPLLLVRNIEQFLSSDVEEFSAGELSVICLAFFITNTSFGSVDAMEKLANTVLHSLPSGTLKLYQMGSILKALRHAHFEKISFYDNLGCSLSSSTVLQQESTLSDLSNIAFTYASLRISSQMLFASISSHAVRLIQNQSRMRVKDIGRLVWSFALLQEPLDEAVQNQLLFILRRDAHLMEQFSEAFTEALLGLAMQKTYPLDMLQQLFSTKFPKQKHVADFRFQLIHSAAAVECAEYTRLQLKPDVRGPKDTHKLKIEMCARQGLLSLATTLYQLLGDPAYVQCHHVLPHTKITDVELRVDDCRRPVKFNDRQLDVSVVKGLKLTDRRFTPSDTQNSIAGQLLMQSASPSVNRMDSGFVHVMPEKMLNSSQRRVILKVMGWNQYIVNRPSLTGIHQLELRLLSKMGYEVLVISARQAQQLDTMSRSHRLDFVRDVLVNQLNVDISQLTVSQRS